MRERLAATRMRLNPTGGLPERQRSPAMAILQAENLTKIYGSGSTAVTALDHVNLTIEPQEFVAIMGPSGCGKSTLLHLLGGLDLPSEGRVRIDSTDLSS